MPAERAHSVAGIVLAAGTSTRMGRNKLLFSLGGESVIRRAVGRVISAQLDPVIVVLGHEAAHVATELAGMRCETVVNEDYASGINSSLNTGIRALPSRTRAAVVLLADMPFVTPDMLVALVDRYRAGDAPLVISDYEGVNAPPMLYDRALFAELLTMTGEGCGRQVVKRHRGEAEVLSWSAAALTDLDVPDDLLRVEALLAAG